MTSSAFPNIEELFVESRPLKREKNSTNLYIPYSRKAGRDVHCYGHKTYDLWAHLEADPCVLRLNEQLNRISLVAGRQVVHVSPQFITKSRIEKCEYLLLHFFSDCANNDVDGANGQLPIEVREILAGWASQRGIEIVYWDDALLQRDSIHLENKKRLLRYVCSPSKVVAASVMNSVLSVLGNVRKITLGALLTSVSSNCDDETISAVAELILNERCYSDIDKYPLHLATEISIHYGVFTHK